MEWPYVAADSSSKGLLKIGEQGEMIRDGVSVGRWESCCAEVFGISISNLKRAWAISCFMRLLSESKKGKGFVLKFDERVFLPYRARWTSVRK